MICSSHPSQIKTISQPLVQLDGRKTKYNLQNLMGSDIMQLSEKVPKESEYILSFPSIFLIPGIQTRWLEQASHFVPYNDLGSGSYIQEQVKELGFLTLWMVTPTLGLPRPGFYMKQMNFYLV